MSKLDNPFNNRIHHTAIIGDNVTLGQGVKIGAFCEIRDGVTIGDNTTFGSRCTISAGAKIGSNCTIKYGFVLTDTPDITNNEVKAVGSVGDNVSIGANVTLMPNINIGKGAVIGACSQVRNHIPDNAVAYGNPAKIYKYNK